MKTPMQDLRGFVASALIMVSIETKGKTLSELNFNELIDVVTDVVKSCSIHTFEKQIKCTHFNEVQRQGDGFIYTFCKDCGIDLD